MGTGEAEVALIEVDSVVVIEEALGEGEEVTVEDMGQAKWTLGEFFFIVMHGIYLTAENVFYKYTF